MKVFFTSPTKQDQKEFEDAGLKASLLDAVSYTHLTLPTN